MFRALASRFRSSTRLRVARAVFRTSKPIGLLLSASTILVGVAPTAMRIAMAELGSRLFLTTGRTDHGIFVLCSALVGLYLLTLVAPNWQTALSSMVRVRLTHVMQRQLMGALLAPVGVAHLENKQTLDLTARARGSLSGYSAADAPMYLSVVVSSRINGVVAALVLARYNPVSALVLVVLWFVIGSQIRRVIMNAVKIMGGDAHLFRRAQYFDELNTSVSTAKESRIFGLSGWISDRFMENWNAARALGWKERARLNTIAARYGALVLAVYGATLGWLAWAAYTNRLSLFSFVLVLLSVPAINSCGTFGSAGTMLEFTLDAFPQLDALDAELSEGPTQARPVVAAKSAPERTDRLTSSIDFEAVTFSYPEALDMPIFHDLSLSIPAECSTAIVGANGAGKSTLIKLLTRLYEPTAGRILADGTDVASIPIDRWRAQISCVFQDFIRYPATAFDNIALDEARDLGRFRSAVSSAAIADLIDSLPNGHETFLSKAYRGGADLSGGEWQRLAVARALYRLSVGGILILDEPTSAMDVRAEAAFYERFVEATSGATSILISHRFGTIRKAQKIIVLAGGRVVEQGSHDELMDYGGHYRRMFTLQADMYQRTDVQ